MNLTNAKLLHLTLHYVGNKINDGKFTSTGDFLPLNEDLSEKLTQYYLNRFSETYERYRFFHASSLKFNEVYNFAKDIFKDPESLGRVSQSIAGHLFDQSTHPNIKPGELHIVYFQQCEYNGKAVDALGIFKTETKSGYFEVNEKGKALFLGYREGLDAKKPEKGCLIFNVSGSEGYELCILDSQGKHAETQYWTDHFLGIIQLSTEYAQTTQLLSLAKGYVSDGFSEDFDVNKKDQADMLNRSIEYFKTHDSFSKKEFEKEVLYHPEVIKSYRKFEQQYEQFNDIEVPDSFDISPQAVKKQQRVFKSILKLDKNFHIYIHGNRDLIERGVEKDGRKFYKIYFDEEQ